ncbi:hypothetical protein [Rhodothermus marinus]|uniref:HNH endonuclease 5 domain-containing protein n=1 Tax=Rhodothermus marinus (strain ATCC 43812 / DSM 4252 / R-10) TaxID=518766 RepID=D0MDA8_RHOM4|nr:hypothetical protein [Rhodothermus marinus]ACY49020.1 hypothetical protein Rmar_2141 [Rhodothermus marinus DSM 4252]
MTKGTDKKKIDKMKSLNNLVYGPIGYCIYCGAKNDLSDEHILPFGLSGTAKLLKSTCNKCAKITGMIEQDVLRGPLWAVRILLNLKSRTKHKEAPEKYPLSIIRKNKKEIVYLPLKEYPVLLHFPIFSPPGFLQPENYSGGIHLEGVITISFGPSIDEVMRKLKTSKIEIEQSHKPISFARMIAKIAYAMAAAENQLSLLKEVTVRSAILGETDDIGRWVGTLTRPLQAHKGTLHRVIAQFIPPFSTSSSFSNKSSFR